MMKTVRICSPERNIDIHMPNFLFWFFRRFAKFSHGKLPEQIDGGPLPIIFCDGVADDEEGEMSKHIPTLNHCKRCDEQWK